jgi:hypothetical protein
MLCILTRYGTLIWQEHLSVNSQFCKEGIVNDIPGKGMKYATTYATVYASYGCTDSG